MTEPDWARPMVHWEIRAQDPEKQQKFYAELFNWSIVGEGRIKNIGAGIGAPEQITGHIAPSEAPGVGLYIQVRDLRASLNRAAELGGAIAMEPRDLPTGVTIAGITDPEGNRVTLVQQ